MSLYFVHKKNQYMLLLRIIILLLSLPACINQQGNAQETFQKSLDQLTSTPSLYSLYKVVKIKDGDTFVLLVEGKELVVRLAHIDCPEKKQPFGTKAKQFASDLCFGKYVTISHEDKYDRNKRLIAEIILEDGRYVNKELVKIGLAWHFKQYSNDNDYAVLEITAREKQIGLWAEANPVEPWLWRKKK